MKRFCVKCGVEESTDIHIINGLCPKCFIEVHGVSKTVKIIKIKYCSRCGAIFYDNKWISTVEKNPEYIVKEIVLDHLKFGEGIKIVDISVDLNPYTNSTIKVNTIFEFSNRFRFQYELPIQIQWNRSVCPACLKKAGGGYSSVVQIRYINWDEDIVRFIEEIDSMFREYISDIEEVKNGYDIKLIDVHIAKRIVELAKRRWKSARIVESYGDSRKLKDGSRYSRLYISIKILNLKEGDYVILDGRPYRVTEVSEREIVMLDQNGTLHRVGINELSVKYMKSRIKTRNLEPL